MRRVMIVHPHDPGIPHVGGVGTFINTFIKYAPSDFQVNLVGVSFNPARRPLGRWQELAVDGRRFQFFPIVASHPTFHTRFPLTLRFVAALLAKRRSLPSSRDTLLEFHRIETELAFRNWPNRRVLFLHTHTKDLYNPKTEVHWKRFPWLYFRLERSLIRSMDGIYSVREDIIDWYRELYPELKIPFTFLPTWVDEETFRSYPDEERKSVRKELAEAYGLDPSGRFVLFVGRFELQKDPLLLLESFRILSAKMPDASLILIGGGSMERTLREFAVRHGLEEQVRFIEPQPQSSVARWMNAADCLTLTSAYEGLPRVVIEAMRCGLPSVCVDNGEVSRLIRGPETGKRVPSRDPEAIRDALFDQLSRKPDRPALREAVREFGAERILSKLFASYCEMNGTHVREREALAS